MEVNNHRWLFVENIVSFAITNSKHLKPGDETGTNAVLYIEIGNITDEIHKKQIMRIVFLKTQKIQKKHVTKVNRKRKHIKQDDVSAASRESLYNENKNKKMKLGIIRQAYRCWRCPNGVRHRRSVTVNHSALMDDECIASMSNNLTRNARRHLKSIKCF